MSSSKSVDGGARSVAPPKPEAENKESVQRDEQPQKPERSEVRESRNKDSFEAARPKAKVDLNPAPPPTRPETEAATRPDEPDQKADADAADAARREQIDAELARTETGRQARQTLDRTGAKVA